MFSGSRMTAGAQFMNDINDGKLQQTPTEFVARVQTEVSSACEELIEVGARVRPLFASGTQMGWVRGVHLSERKALQRWVFDSVELMEHVLLLGTTLTKPQLTSLTAVELRSLFRVVEEMTQSDLLLFPFLSAFTTTSVSEQLWCARGSSVAAFQKKSIELPDGHTMQLSQPSDHARLWATLCAHRDKNRRRNDDAMNALLIVRPWVGKGADSMAAELRAAARAFIPDSAEPWTEIAVEHAHVVPDDGWAHSEDNSLEGIQRELHGMVSNDRHEQLITEFERQIKEKADKEANRIEALIESRGQLGVYEERTEILTAAEASRPRLRAGRPASMG
jgi:hypothetical protein